MSATDGGRARARQESGGAERGHGSKYTCAS
uniref:Uncharacterized protein n=1 Tax=Arundo donax TaxID=35708 RepID=A0A0A8YFX1_ARUDO